MQLKSNISKNKIVLFTLLLSIMVFFSWLVINTFTADVNDSAWDGVVATSFKRGTGTTNNPYVIESAGELAYFKNLLEGNSSSLYLDKNYVIEKGFNCGDYDFSINNTNPFTGTIDGKGNAISNLKITDSFFSDLDNATIKNLIIKEIDYEKENENVGVFAKEINNSNLDLVYIEVSNTNDSTNYSAISYKATGSTISNIITNLNTSDENTYSLFYEINNTNINNVLVNNSLKTIKNNNGSTINNLNKYIDINTININSFNNGIYRFNIENNTLIITPTRQTNNEENPVLLHDSGVDGNSLYVNDLEKDYDYYMGLNYSKQGNSTLPNGTSSNTYNDSNLVKVYLHYSGVDINDSSLIGYIGNSERVSELYYYKYAVIVNNKVTIELIDNPYGYRPNNKGFNGWVTALENAKTTYDNETYTRYLEISNVTSTDTIEVNLNATWIDANILTTTSSINSNINSTFKNGMVEYEPEIIREYEDVSNYYVSTTIDYGDYYVNSGEGVFNTSGTRITDTTCRSWWNGCTYLIKSNSSEYDSSKTYYTLVAPNNNTGNATVSRHTVTYTDIVIPIFEPDEIIAGNYEQVSVSRNTSIAGLYDSNGNIQSGNCTSSTCTLYKLLQYEDRYDVSKSYYYLSTRDVNIYAPSGNITSSFTISRPMTITGLHNGTLNNRRIQSTMTINYDLRIENIQITSTTKISGNNHNVKIGRNVATSSSLQIQGGYANSASGYKEYKTVVESGTYANIFSAIQSTNSSSNYGHAMMTVGCDYDRVTNNNDNLEVVTRLTPGQQSYVYGTSKTLTTDVLNEIVVKSGDIGTEETSELTGGIYMGILGGGGINVSADIRIEGGHVNKIIGGVSRSTSWEDKNFVYINVTGGVVDSIIGGASYGTTQGNRIINITGGKITYSVFGGSNGAYLYSNSYTAALESSTFINVGGHATIGTTENNLVYSYGSTRYPNSTVEPGSIFGAGNGQTNNLNVGKVANSVITVNGNAKVNGNIYGGGNNGTIGVNNEACSSKIYVNGGEVAGSVYAGGNNNGAGSQSGEATTNIYINGGTVGNVYGGSRTSGTLYGSSSVNINSGTITNNVYGGGEGNNTYVSKNATVVVGTNSTSPIIAGSVYGGSAYGTVNSTSRTGTKQGNTAVTINSGIISGSVFGGGEGSTSYTPYVLGNINVTVNGGDITAVFGGNDQAGSHNLENRIDLNGGIVGSVYGGGNKSNVKNTNIYLTGSNVTSIYGGSNVSGNVTSTNININSGTVGNIFGGNNLGGTCATSSILVQGTATITNAIYGGGNEVDTTTTGINVVSAASTIPNIYGGGNKSSVTTATITKGNVSVTNIFGGSNLSGTVSESNINHNGGTTTNIYGGNNDGGNTIESNIIFTSGNADTIYGGGNNANGDIANITVNSGTINKIYGGGNSAGINESHVTLNGGTINETYGGSNNKGKVNTTNLNIYTTVGNVYGGGNLAVVGNTNILIDGGNIGNVYGGGNLAKAEGNTNVDIKNSTINTNIYGGGNYGEVTGSSDVRITDTNVLGSIYGGGNGETAILSGNTNVSLDGKTVVGTQSSIPPHTGSVFGGGNKAYTGSLVTNNSTSNVNIAGAKIYGNVYGGANTSVIYGNTNVNIGVDTITDKTLKKDDIYIKGHVFGGGEANAEGSENYDWYFISVTEGVIINVDANSYSNFDILGSFYGGGNASSSSGDSYLYLNNYGYKEHPKNNVSIQRVTYATLNNSSISLKGAIDRANDYDTELFSISRVNTLTLKNNSELYLATGANLLENFNSVDENDNLATVNITEDSVTKNVDNRVYVYEGRNLNIARDQQVTEYGKVSGMTFFGLFSFNYDNTVYTGNYSSNYDMGDELSWAGAFTRGSYVLGAHEQNHDITKNGFYSNFMNEDTLLNEVRYIEPTPTDAKFYMWFIGENVIEYNVNLTASKYSTLGSLELSFLEFTEPNTSFEILNFDSSELADGISLVDKNEIPRIALDENDANNIFGLSMEASNAGWLTSGKTSFYTSDPSMSGVTYYEGENSTTVPTMLFYLYHSKNISVEKELGTARISVMAITKKSALSNEIKRLVINVNMSTALFQTVEYEGAMTPGDKYELFTSTSNNITSKSKLSAYYALYGENENLYKTGYHRVLTSTYVLPLNTKITMIDFANNETNYYYHIIDENDVLNATAEYQLHNEVSYPLSLFTKMGSKENTERYSDAEMNAIYYDGTNSSEEFIFIVDFSKANITEDKLSNKLLIEIRDGNNESMFTVLGIEHNQLTYNLYYNKDSRIDTTITPSANPLYIGYNDIFDLNVDYHNEALNGNAIIDTQYFNSKLGVQIKVVNKDGKTMSGTDLVGTYFEVDGTKYYPDIYGVTHIKLSDKVGNIRKWLIFNSDNSSLPTGDYDFIFETFGSLDGIYYGDSLPDYKNLDIIIINSEYGLDPIIDDNSVVFNSINDKDMHFNIRYESSLDNPNIRISLYRRRYNSPYEGNYGLVDLADYINQTLFETTNEKEYLLINNPNPENQLDLVMKENLLTGTYRVVFKLYDGDVLIGDVVKYIIIKEGS